MGNLTLLDKIKIEIRNREMRNYDDDFLTLRIEEAIYKVNERRRFVPTETDLYDKKYESQIINVVLVNLSKIGAEGQLSHSENGIARMYESDILNSIIPLVKTY